MIRLTKLKMAYTWSEEVEARLITSCPKLSVLYDVADEHYDYLSHV